MGVAEAGSRLLRIFELADLSGESGPLAFDKPSGRFGRALPGRLGRSRRGGSGLDVVAASVPGEEPPAGVLYATEVLLLDSARWKRFSTVSTTGSAARSASSEPSSSQTGSVDAERHSERRCVSGSCRAADQPSVSGIKLVGGFASKGFRLRRRFMGAVRCRSVRYRPAGVTRSRHTAFATRSPSRNALRLEVP